MTFHEYVLRRRKTDNPAGDFCSDVRRDRAFPTGTITRKELFRHLDANPHTCDEAREAAGVVWRNYVAYVRATSTTPTSE